MLSTKKPAELIPQPSLDSLKVRFHLFQCIICQLVQNSCSCHFPLRTPHLGSQKLELDNPRRDLLRKNGSNLKTSKNNTFNCWQRQKTNTSEIPCFGLLAQASKRHSELNKTAQGQSEAQVQKSVTTCGHIACCA